MKKVYWRPSKVPRSVLVVIGILAIAMLLSVEFLKTKKRQPHYQEKIQAARAMKYGMEAIRQYRIKNIGPIDPEVDPANSGLIGLLVSPITSTTGYLPAKQTTVNPNWAAVMVAMFKEVGAKGGDVIAIGFSGSFPAINLAIFVAAETLKLKVVAINSVSASTWGANIADLTWLDMERILHSRGVISHRSVAATLGAEEDMALGITKRGREMLHASIERNNVRFLDVQGMKENIDARMAIYQELAEGHRIVAYVNVGGGAVSVGRTTGKRLYEPGLNRRPRPRALKVDSVMSRFARQGIPLIHMVRMDTLAETYGLPKSPLEMPNVGDGHIFVSTEYNLYLAMVNLVILLFVLIGFLRFDIGFRIFGSSRTAQAPTHPEPMV